MNSGDDGMRQKAVKHQQLAIQHFRDGNLQIALKESREAADIDATNIQLQNLVGAIALETDDVGIAQQYLQHSLSLENNQAETHYLLGNAHSKLYMDEEAVASFKTALSLDSSHANAAMNLGFCHERLGELGDAERAFRRAIEIHSDHPEANNALANLYIRKTQYDKAEHHARLAVAATPSKIEMNLTLAKALRFLNRNAEAEEIYRIAASIHPHNALLLIELGGALRDQNKFEEAEKVFEKAVELAPKNGTVLRAASSYYQSIRSFQKGGELCERYLEISPDDAGMLNNMAINAREINRFDDAERYYLRSIEINQKSSSTLNNLAILAMEMGKPVESIDYYKKALEIKPGYAAARSNMLFYMNYLGDMPAKELFEEHLKWPHWHAEPLTEEKRAYNNEIDPDRRLKIGYISADLFGHAVSYFIEGAIANHDHEKFDIYCYANVSTPDGVTERLRENVENWHYINKMKAQEIADLIREDGIDILVDLSGHTAGNRLNVIVHKPAPIIVNWIGYPNTTGLDVVDYRFVDHVTDPVGVADELHSEKLWRLPRSFTCYTPQSDFPVSEELSAMKTGYVTFGSFNNASKISPSTIETWSHILKKVKGSRLVLKSTTLSDKGTQKRFLDQFKSHGISSKRIVLKGKVPTEEHMRMYDEIDICLDTFPYNGTTTTCEAMLMGAPVICLLGDRHASRVSASLMTQVGLQELAAENVEAYVEKAVALANDLPRLGEIRKNLRQNMLASPLCDAEGHTREIEDAYREMWKTWCEEEPARRKKRKDAGLPPTEPYKPVLPIIHAFGNESYTQFCQCLGSMKNISLLTEIHPLGMKIFPPLVQAQKYFDLFEEDEWEILSVKNTAFSDALMRIYSALKKRGERIAVTDWSHLDFIAQPFLAAPSYEVYFNTAVKHDFDVRDIYIVRHPLSQWVSYSEITNVCKHITIDDFLAGYRRFAEHAVEGKWYRCEDFAANPDQILKEICQHFELPFDPEYTDNWPFYMKVSGDITHRTLEHRALDELSAPVELEAYRPVLEQMEESPDYTRILELLGYDQR